MLSVWDNKSRKCFVKEDALSSEFKRIVYPDLIRLDHETNNMICMIKEFYSGFSTDQKFVKMIRATDNLLASRLALDIHDLVSAKITEIEKVKTNLRTELTNLVNEKAKKIDVELRKYAEKTAVLKNLDLPNKSPALDRVKFCTEDYNKQAEECRQKDILKNSLQYFFNLQLRSETQENPEPLQNNVPEQYQEEQHQEEHSSSNSSDDARVVTWTSEPIFTLSTQSNLDLTASQTNQNDTSRMNTDPKVQQIQPQQPPAPAPAPVDYAHIIANTKFEQVEQLQLDGFPSNNYIYCIEPATGDKNSFDVGTYGMII
jgi:hypothetical protein